MMLTAVIKFESLTLSQKFVNYCNSSYSVSAHFHHSPTCVIISSTYNDDADDAEENGIEFAFRLGIAHGMNQGYKTAMKESSHDQVNN